MKELTTYCNTLAQLIHDSKVELLIPKMDTINHDKESSQFFFALLFKLSNGLETSNLLLINLDNKPQFADSLFICLRTLLLDMLTIDYLMIQANFNENEVQRQVDILKSDHVQYDINNLKTYQTLFNFSDADLEKKRKEIINQYPKFFEQSGKFKSEFKDHKVSPKQMILEINKNASNTIFLENAIQTYEHYDLYSKYEHLGEYTAQLVFRGFRNENFENLFKEVKTCLKLLLKFHYAILTEFYDENHIKNTKYWKSYGLMAT